MTSLLEFGEQVRKAHHGDGAFFHGCRLLLGFRPLPDPLPPGEGEMLSHFLVGGYLWEIIPAALMINLTAKNPEMFFEPDPKPGIRRNFARRAASYDAHAGVQRLMGDQLLAAAAEFLPKARRLLEIGCGTGYFTELLRRAAPQAHLVALDLDAALVAAARRRLGPGAGVDWLVADGEAVEIRGCDVIIANASFQWFSRPAATLESYGRSLPAGGVLAFSTLGPGTFWELAAALRQAAEALRLPTPEIAAARFLDPEAWGALLTRAGFSRLQISQETLTVSFPSVRAFLKSLQATGATNPRPQPFSPRFLAALTSAYKSAPGQHGSIPATYDIILAVARK